MATADFTGTRTTRVHGIPDALADALADALLGLREVTPPDTNNFDDLTHIIATASRVIQHLDAFRELAIVAADDTSPHADRKAIAAADPGMVRLVADPTAFIDGGMGTGHRRRSASAATLRPATG
jgi:hypothetical protein